MPLTLRPAGLGSGIDKDRQDYTVYTGGGDIGRIYEVRGGPHQLRWFWSFTLHGPMTRSDRAATLEEAKAEFQKSWDAWKAWAYDRSRRSHSQPQHGYSCGHDGHFDPIGNGLVASFARPGGNTTGVTLFSNELAGKRLEMLNQLVRQLRRVAILAERDRPPTATLVSETQAAAQALRLDLRTFEVRPEEIAEALRSIDKERADAVIVQQNLSFTPHLRQIADLAISYRLPTVHPTREFVEAGGLLAYGPSLFALGERAGWYVDRILKGTKPADLPVEQPTKFEVILNLKTAKALDLTIPDKLLAVADEVIERRGRFFIPASDQPSATPSAGPPWATVGRYRATST